LKTANGEAFHMNGKERPIVCELTPEAIRTRRQGLLPGLAEVAKERRPLADGYQLVLEPSDAVIQRTAAVIEAERQCCRWLQFELIVPPEGAPIVLTLRGPEGARAFLSSLIESEEP
jgi:hypothetical protein